MKKMRKKCWLFGTLVTACLFALTRADNDKQKRQIFREQVLPALGGKIPEEAFRSDRLALNRLNKEGITIPDGVVLDARRVVKYSDSVMSKPELIKVYLTPDGRYVPPEGRFHYNSPKTVETTYVIRMPIEHRSRQKPTNSHGYKPRDHGKPRGYVNYRQFLPVEAQAFKPIISPLVIPTRGDLLDDEHYPIWHYDPDWEVFYNPYSHFPYDKFSLFDSHQIITDYQGFAHQFHGRALRHIDRAHDPGLQAQEKKRQRPSRGNAAGSKVGPAAASGYTDLTSVPETMFSCAGRTGTFADVETKCQVFHECTAWAKTSSLCPKGTAYSEATKRCEWWHDIVCK